MVFRAEEPHLPKTPRAFLCSLSFKTRRNTVEFQGNFTRQIVLAIRELTIDYSAKDLALLALESM
jgi:hypothetical protein